MKKWLKNWWNSIKYEPTDPRYHGTSDIKIAAIGGGTGLSTLLRGIKKYSNHISAIVAVTDDGGACGDIRREFDILPPSDIRKCISALAYDEELISKLLEHRFGKDKKSLGGHTLGNVWITALTDYFGSFEKAIETTTEIFQTAGKVLPSSLDNADLKITYSDHTVLVGESKLDEIVKPIEKVELTKQTVRAYNKAVDAILAADLIIVGPGSLYGSLIPNLLVPGIKRAIIENKTAVKVYIANCSTERTQTGGYSIDDHISVLKKHAGRNLFDFCLVNDNIVSTSKDDAKLGEINNITTDKESIDGINIVVSDIVNVENPLYHDPAKLAKAIVELYNRVRE